MNKIIGFVLFLMLLAAFALSHAGSGHDQKTEVVAADSTSEALDRSALTGEQINWQVLSSGGTDAAATGFLLKGTVGQPATGSASSDLFRLHHGFWQGSDAVSCCSIRGDIDHDGTFNPIDAIYIVDYFWKSGPPPPCTSEADVNGSGAVDPLDASYLVMYLWNGGPPPVPCP